MRLHPEEPEATAWKLLGRRRPGDSDDLAWHHDPFDWADILVDEVIGPWRRGDAVSFRPPGWVAKRRPGAVEVPPRPVRIVEGVGAGRACLAAQAEFVVWVQSDHEEPAPAVSRAT